MIEEIPLASERRGKGRRSESPRLLPSFFEKRSRRARERERINAHNSFFPLSFALRLVRLARRCALSLRAPFSLPLSHTERSKPRSPPSLSLKSLDTLTSLSLEEKNFNMSAAVMQENVAPAAEVHAEEMDCGPMPIEKLQVRPRRAVASRWGERRWTTRRRKFERAIALAEQCLSLS